MNTIKRKLGEQLKLIRNLKGYTQEALAEKVGINLRQLARIEAGESFIKADTLFKICMVLNISPSFLFDFELENETFSSETDKNLHFNVIKNENTVKFIPKAKNENGKNSFEEKSFDSKMISMAQKIQKDININEFSENVLVCRKIFTAKGEIKILDKIQKNENSFDELKENLNKIANDKNKVEYMNLAFQSLFSSKVLKDFLFLLKGLELSAK